MRSSILNNDQKKATSKSPGHDEVLYEADIEVKRLLEVFRVIPGKLRIDAVFGRLCCKNPNPANVKTDKNPDWPVETIMEGLNGGKFPQESLGFYTQLTTHGAEAEILSQTWLLGGAKWELVETRTFYDFICRSRGGNDFTIVVEVDADTFEYRSKGEMQETSCLYIHCPRRAWDIKVALSHCGAESVPKEFPFFADRKSVV